MSRNPVEPARDGAARLAHAVRRARGSRMRLRVGMNTDRALEELCQQFSVTRECIRSGTFILLNG